MTISACDRGCPCRDVYYDDCNLLLRPAGCPLTPESWTRIKMEANVPSGRWLCDYCGVHDCAEREHDTPSCPHAAALKAVKKDSNLVLVPMSKERFGMYKRTRWSTPEELRKMEGWAEIINKVADEYNPDKDGE